MNKYLLRIKALVDNLIAIGSLIFAEKHIEAIFEGLSANYDLFIASVNMHLEPYIVSEIDGSTHNCSGGAIL